jgi:small subunit ribosomal protein S33
MSALSSFCSLAILLRTLYDSLLLVTGNYLRSFTDKPPQLQCSIFSTTFNPTQQRLGNNVLRQRLKGPELAAYYPRKSATVVDIIQEFKKHDLETWNEEEEDRLELLAITKLRGKGAPKKKREKDREYITAVAIGKLLIRFNSQERQKEVISWFQQVFGIPRYPRIYVQHTDAFESLRQHAHASFPVHCSTSRCSEPHLSEPPLRTLSDLVLLLQLSIFEVAEL